MGRLVGARPLGGKPWRTVTRLHICNVNETGFILPHVEHDPHSWELSAPLSDKGQVLPDDANSVAAPGNYSCKRYGVKKGFFFSFKYYVRFSVREELSATLSHFS
jgi:hypothetical protein